jgi:hypothetical protein
MFYNYLLVLAYYCWLDCHQKKEVLIVVVKVVVMMELVVMVTMLCYLL